MKRDMAYERYLQGLESDVERRSERVAAAWRRILPFFDPLELRFADLERREQQAAMEAELNLLRSDAARRHD